VHYRGSSATRLYDPRLVDAFDDDVTNHRARDPVSPNRLSMIAWTREEVASRMLYLM